VHDGTLVADSVATSDGPSASTRTLVQFVFLAALGALLFNFHGISMHLTPWSQAIVNAIVKFTYDQTGQDKTLVVLFREENLATLKESFPISYARHAEVLEALTVHVVGDVLDVVAGALEPREEVATAAA